MFNPPRSEPLSGGVEIFFEFNYDMRHWQKRFQAQRTKYISNSEIKTFVSTTTFLSDFKFFQNLFFPIFEVYFLHKA